MDKRVPLATAILLISGLAFGEGSFERNDTNGDGQLSRDEYYGLISDAGIYSDYDTNGDDILDVNEVESITKEVDFSTWDTDGDGYVSDTEFYDVTFDYYDRDGDGRWDDDEWDRVNGIGWSDF